MKKRLLCLMACSLAALLRAGDGESAESLHQRATAAHRARNLGEAGGLYDRLLALDPPPDVTEARRALAYQYAPRLHTVKGEFFALRDVVAVVHPARPLIAYHLFWEDDIAYPADNEPSDHEIVWVGYDPATGAVTSVQTYFHGRILGGESAVKEANAHGGRPWIGVEWGFHGSVPHCGLEAARDKLAEHWRHARRGRETDHPLARGWPRSYPGTWEEFARFDVLLDPVPMLKARDLIEVTRWANAVINRRCLRYNFAAKPEWPGETIQPDANTVHLSFSQLGGPASARAADGAEAIPPSDVNSIEAGADRTEPVPPVSRPRFRL